MGLFDCMASHEESAGISRTQLEPEQLPVLSTRVLDVGKSDKEVRLHEAKGEKGHYVALSYRWGDANMNLTTNATLLEHLENIDISTICTTIRDAILVTREIGFRYLWADSLCIIQDSEEDWEQEALRMGEIYQNCTLSITASVATSGDSSLFGVRKPSHNVEMPYYKKRCQPAGFYFISDHEWYGVPLGSCTRHPSVGVTAPVVVLNSLFKCF
jgi:hypothetical protein